MSDDELERRHQCGRKILIAMDGSDSATKAFEWYMQNMFRGSDKVFIAYCADKGNNVSSNHSDHDTIDQHDIDVKKVFKDIEDIANKYRIRHLLVRLFPPVGQAVVKAAAVHDVDLIVVGNNRPGVAKRNESTCSYVVQHSHSAVLVCAFGEDEGPSYSQSVE